MGDLRHVEQAHLVYLLITACIWLGSFSIPEIGFDGSSSPAWTLFSILRWALLLGGLIWVGVKLAETQKDQSTNVASYLAPCKPPTEMPRITRSAPEKPRTNPTEMQEQIRHREKEERLKAVRAMANEEAKVAAEIQKLRERSAHDAVQSALDDFL